jgi:hypothetical protein
VVAVTGPLCRDMPTAGATVGLPLETSTGSRPAEHQRGCNGGVSVGFPASAPTITYHQQYLAKNPSGYCGIGGCGVPFNSAELAVSEKA